MLLIYYTKTILKDKTIMKYKAVILKISFYNTTTINLECL